MKKNNFKMSLWAALMLLGSVVMTGCVSETDCELPASDGEGNLYISINAEGISSSHGYSYTRGVEINTDPSSTYENYLDKTLVCLFNNDGNLVQYREFDDLSGAEQVKAEFSGESYAAGNTIAVISNLPSSIHTAIKGKLDNNATTPYTLTMMRAEKYGIVDALNTDVLTTTDADRRIPMYGEGTLVADENNFYVSVPVKHSLVKVTLDQLVVDFGESSTRSAHFTPDQVFLTNVPDEVNMSADVAIHGLDFGNGSKMYQGDAAIYYAADADAKTTYDTAHSGDADPKSSVVKTDADKKMVDITTVTASNVNVIGTDKMTPVAADELYSGNSNWAKKYYFYTLPNAETAENATCLVVSGEFDAQGDDTDKSRVYYSVRLGGAAGTLEPNKNYKVKIILYGKGGTDAYTAGADPTIVESYINAVNFTDQEQNVILGGGYSSYTSYGDIVKVGDILFSDGKFKSQTEARAYHDANIAASNGTIPVGIVFHMFNAAEQAADQYNGKTGLVMALMDASTGAAWPTGDDQKNKTRLSLTPHDAATAPGSIAVMDPLRRRVAGEMKNLTIAGNNGMNNWTAMTDKGTDNAFTAVSGFTVPAPSGTSGWYLPSIGELYKMTYSLGRLNTGKLNVNNMTWGNAWTADQESAAAADAKEGKTWNWTPWGMYYDGEADNVRKNINALINIGTKDTHYNYFSGGKNYPGNAPNAGGDVTGNEDFTAATAVFYWSSSEWSGRYAFRLAFYGNGNLYFYRAGAKSNAYRVRPVLAF